VDGARVPNDQVPSVHVERNLDEKTCQYYPLGLGYKVKEQIHVAKEGGGGGERERERERERGGG
jgi:hypothetical protein